MTAVSELVSIPEHIVRRYFRVIRKRRMIFGLHSTRRSCILVSYGS